MTLVNDTNPALKTFGGLERCSRYAFGPNRLHYCGPDANRELKELIEESGDDFGLAHLLRQFKTLFPYLRRIAEANNIADSFDARVVEAYWLGNELLDNVRKDTLYDFLTQGLKVKDKMKNKEFSSLEEKIGAGALPHHSFHVLNVWSQSGHADKLEDIERIGECIISSGKVTQVSGSEITVATEPLICQNGKLSLGSMVSKKITRQLECEYDSEQIKPGQIVSIHWSVPCEVITPRQAAKLRACTLRSLRLANLNL